MKFILMLIGALFVAAITPVYAEIDCNRAGVRNKKLCGAIRSLHWGNQADLYFNLALKAMIERDAKKAKALLDLVDRLDQASSDVLTK